jgi:broad specificity phosphatase PhoE
MSLFYLIRHGEHDWLQRGIAGRMPGVHLNEAGRKQVDELADRLKGVRFDTIFSSPLERAIETAEPIAKAQGKALTIAPEILELDFGEWNGKTRAELDADPRWAKWNRDRTTMRMPGGELMSEVQSRVVTFLSDLHAANPNGVFAIVSHGDSIRAAICYWLGMPMDLLPRIDIDTASISILKLDAGGPHVAGINLKSLL